MAKKDSSVEIDLGWDLFLRSDSANWILSERREGKKGHYWKDISFHTDLEGVLKRVVELRARLSGAKSFSELREAVTTAQKQLGRVQALDTNPFQSS